MKKTKFLLVAPLLLGAASSMTSCSSSSSASNKLTLRILNSEDYIYLNDPQDPESLPDLIDQFVDWVNNNEDPEINQYAGCSVVYDTSDTNETIYSELLTGKSNYDLMNVSDYMAQKIVAGNMAVPLQREIENYETYASKTIKGILDDIEATRMVYNESTKSWEPKTERLEDYAVGYMWGTLGILFNPSYFTDDYDEQQEILKDMASFDALWNPKYKGTISIKNSMRDTFAVGLLEAYKDEFQDLADKLAADEITVEEYQAQFADIFNRCDQETVNLVKGQLDSLKNNIFGLEVDSGKQDIVTKKIGVNLAWSGDAVYSMEQAEDPEQVGENISELYYSVPELGSNVWMDTWIMPDCPRSEEQAELAHLFLEFVCDPENAYQNMEYTGYTSFIGGDSIVELVRDWYDYRTYEMYQDEEFLIYSASSVDFAPLDYCDFLSTDHDPARDNEDLWYFEPYEDDDGELVEEPTSLEDLFEHGGEVYILDENDEPTEDQKTYGDLTIVDEDDSIEAVDLTYFFEGTIDEYTDDDLIFYSDCYLANVIDDMPENVAVGRFFFCQYPSAETIVRTAVMRDYGENNKLVMKMWEDFKSDPLPTPAIVIFMIIIASALAIGGVMIANKVIKNNLRKKRKSLK